ncbi:MAG: hypothetical protein WBY94_21275 [Polyangiaceae bacterium]
MMRIRTLVAPYALLGGICAMGCGGGNVGSTAGGTGAANNGGFSGGGSNASSGTDPNAAGDDAGGGSAATGSGQGSAQPGDDASAASSNPGANPGAGAAPSASDASASSSDAAADPEIAYSVTLTMDAFTVPAGQEVYMCQDFANPFNGMQADIKTYELHMAQGSHHMFAFYKTNATNSSVAPCPQGGLQFAPFTFTAQTQDVVQTYPEGVGATIPSTTGFTLNAHYVNTGSAPVTGHVALTMHVAKTGIITQHAGVIFLNQALLSVPPTATMANPSTSTSTYTLPQDAYVMFSSSHMHKRATNFVSKASSGETLFQTTQWAEPPPATYTPPVHLTSGTNITWSCSYYNDTGQTLTFGESASTNVMCISVSIFYPVQDVNNPVLSTQF